jgi:hypothetical protein
VSHSTLDHFASRDEIECALRELRCVLRRGATLIVTLDNLRQPIVALRNAPAPLWSRLGLPYAMGASLGHTALVSTLERTGFEVVELTAVHHAPRLALVALDRVARRAEAGATGAPWAARLALRCRGPRPVAHPVLDGTVRRGAGARRGRPAGAAPSERAA